MLITGGSSGIGMACARLVVDAGGQVVLAQRADHLSALTTDLPAGRPGTPDEVARAVLSLMTNGFITGACLDVDGGQT